MHKREHIANRANTLLSVLKDSEDLKAFNVWLNSFNNEFILEWKTKKTGAVVIGYPEPIEGDIYKAYYYTRNSDKQRSCKIQNLKNSLYIS